MISSPSFLIKAGGGRPRHPRPSPEAPERPPRPDWHAWVYGSARNPLLDISPEPIDIVGRVMRGEIVIPENYEMPRQIADARKRAAARPLPSTPVVGAISASAGAVAKRGRPRAGVLAEVVTGPGTLVEKAARAGCSPATVCRRMKELQGRMSL